MNNPVTMSGTTLLSTPLKRDAGKNGSDTQL